jgi:hypothetical protein
MRESAGATPSLESDLREVSASLKHVEGSFSIHADILTKAFFGGARESLSHINIHDLTTISRGLYKERCIWSPMYIIGSLGA